MKAHTDLEQSRKLAKMLPLESADMSYRPHIEEGRISDYCATLCPHRFASWVGVPCWSLAALLEVLPNKLQIALAINDFQGERKEKYVIGSVEHDRYDCYADSPVDACYEMIIRLNELKML